MRWDCQFLSLPNSISRALCQVSIYFLVDMERAKSNAAEHASNLEPFQGMCSYNSVTYPSPKCVQKISPIRQIDIL